MSAGARSESSKVGGHDQLSEQKSPALASNSVSMSNQVDTSKSFLDCGSAMKSVERAAELTQQKGKMDAGVVCF